MVIDIKKHQSPNYSSRKNVSIDTIVIHHTGGSYPGCVEWLCNPKAQASAHYVITKDGTVYQLVAEHHNAWHAGRSAFDYDGDGKISYDEKYLNRRSIGIELESDGKSYTKEQHQALEALTENIILRYNVPISQILGHKEIAPDRKWDPGNFNMDDFRALMETILLAKGHHFITSYGDR